MSSCEADIRAVDSGRCVISVFCFHQLTAYSTSLVATLGQRAEKFLEMASQKIQISNLSLSLSL